MPAEGSRSGSPAPGSVGGLGMSRQASALSVRSAEGTNTPTYNIAPKWSFGTRSYADSAQVKEAKTLPGPATYGRVERTDLGDSVRKKGSAFSFGYKNTQDPAGGRSDSPGPGHYYYSVDAVKPSAPPPALKGRGVDLADKDEFPGPGQYQGIYDRQVGRKGTWKFGSEPRIRTKQTIAEQFRATPPPGAYDPPVSTGEGPKHSFGQRNEVEKASDAKPAPGQYDPKKPYWKNPPRTSFGSEPRGKVSRERAKSPGPGAYDAVYRNTIGAPGASPAMAIKPRIPLQDPARIGPGPAYEAPGACGRQVLGRTPSAPPRIRHRLAPPAAANADGPGPGAYKYGLDAVKDGGTRRWSLYGKARPLNPNAEVPGPGQYVGSYDRQVGRKGVWRLYGSDRAASAPDARGALQPGPGQYDPPTSIGETPKWGFGDGHGDSLLRSAPGRDSPAPGSYDVRTRNGRQVESLRKFSGTSIGTADRFGYRKGDQAPGPGQYHVWPETLVPEEMRLVMSRSASHPSVISSPSRS
eukprot:tig00000949_g5744.t1